MFPSGALAALRSTISTDAFVPGSCSDLVVSIVSDTLLAR